MLYSGTICSLTEKTSLLYCYFQVLGQIMGCPIFSCKCTNYKRDVLLTIAGGWDAVADRRLQEEMSLHPQDHSGPTSWPPGTVLWPPELLLTSKVVSSHFIAFVWQLTENLQNLKQKMSPSSRLLVADILTYRYSCLRPPDLSLTSKAIYSSF